VYATARTKKAAQKKRFHTDILVLLLDLSIIPESFRRTINFLLQKIRT